MNEAARDRQVARETVRPRSACHHCNPGAAALLEEVEAAQYLADTTTDGLLTAYASLTHQIHSLSMAEGGTPTDRGLREAAITSRRAERDLIRAEILRRTGDL